MVNYCQLLVSKEIWSGRTVETWTRRIGGGYKFVIRVIRELADILDNIWTAFLTNLSVEDFDFGRMS